MKPCVRCCLPPSMCQPPSGGCVLKQQVIPDCASKMGQPPSGGCVLKHGIYQNAHFFYGPAAFRRLCVETRTANQYVMLQVQPPSGGCVLKHGSYSKYHSDLAAAFRRLCVETRATGANLRIQTQPPSGGCVLKQSPLTMTAQQTGQPPSGGCVLKPFWGQGRLG